MPIVIISSDSYKTGREISKKTAKAAGYDYVDREILRPVAEKYYIKEEKLIKALEGTSSFFCFSSKIRDRCLAYIQEATLGQLLKDNVVCHGLAAHLYVLGVSHALKVRVLSDSEKMARRLSSEAVGSREKMKKLLRRQDAQRKRWSLEAFELDETDPSNYDMIISLSQIGQDKAVKTIADMVDYRQFQPITYSIKCLRDKELACRVRSALIERFPDIRVRANGDTIIAKIKTTKRKKQKTTEVIKELAGSIKGVDHVEVYASSNIF